MSDSSEVHGEPPEGMCCLATMEEITIEDGNYGTWRGLLGAARSTIDGTGWMPALIRQTKRSTDSLAGKVPR
jgi:hypothetical protein